MTEEEQCFTHGDLSDPEPMYKADWVTRIVLKAPFGIINALCNSGHTVVSVERLLPDADPHMDDTKEEL